MDCQEWQRASKERRERMVYGEGCTSDDQIHALVDLIYNSLRLLDELYKDVHPEYVPYDKYMKVLSNRSVWMTGFVFA